MSDTTNFNLSKPAEGALDWDVDLNNNFDIIDEEIKNAQTLTNAKITTALGFTPEDSSKGGVADGFATLNAAGKVPVTQIAINSATVTDALGYTPEDAANKDAAGGYSSLNSSGKVPSANLAITDQIIAESLGFVPENPTNKGVGLESSQTQAAVPEMTSATSGDITISGSGWVNSVWASGGSAYPWSFFNASVGNPHTPGSGGGSGSSASVTVDFGSGNLERIVSYRVGFNSVYCSSANISGSNDQSSWTLLNSSSGSSPTTISFINLNSYRYYKITLYSGGYSPLLPGDLQLYRHVDSGYVSLDANGKVSSTQISLNSSHISDALGFDSENANNRGAVNGYASLDSNGKIPTAQISLSESNVTNGLTFIPQNPSAKDAANGYVGLDVTGKVSSSKLVYNFSKISNLSISAPLTGQTLQYNGTSWVNGAVPSGSSTLAGGLSDVSITSPSSGQILKHNGTAFTNQTGGSSRVTVPVRQTVLSGATERYSGVANFLAAGSGLNVNLSATSVPVNIAFAAGTDSSGAVDYIGTISSDVTNAWTLPSSSTSYLYVERNSSTGALTYGSTTVRPQYQQWLYLGPDLTTGGTATASSTYSGSWPASAAFSDNGYGGSSGTSWLATDGTGSGWLQYQFASAQTIINYTIYADSTRTDNAPKNWTFEASTTGAAGSWVVLDTQTNQTDWATTNGRSYTFSNSTAYTYYRINISAVNNTVAGGAPSNRMGIGEMEMRGFAANVQHWFDLSTMTMKLWNGSSWDTKQRVFVGEAVTNASAVTSVTAYALKGYFESEAFHVSKNTSGSSVYNIAHNIGVDPTFYSTLLRYNSDYKWTEVTQFSDGSGYANPRSFLDYKTIKVVPPYHYIYIASTLTGAQSRPNLGIDSFPSTTDAAPTYHTAGECKVVVSRGW
jgi:hypothetical protein